MAVADSSVRYRASEQAAAQAAKLWGDALEHLQLRLSREGFDTWLVPTRALLVHTDIIDIEVPSSFFAEWLGEHYAAEIRSTLRTLTGRDLELRFRPRDEADAAALRRRGEWTRGAIPRQNGYRLQARYTFTNFVIGESARLACAAARSVAEQPGITYNPLFIYGGVGLGKTHLLQAIGNHALRFRPGVKVHYVAAETLFLELIRAIEKNTRLDFKSKYRGLDILLLDDIHYLIGKERLQEEVFHIFNHLHDAGSQVVFTSDRPPKDIPSLESRLLSRLGSGLVVDVQRPELETRIAILKQKAALERQELPHDVACYVAARAKSSVRELESCLIRLIALASLSDQPVSVELAEDAMKNLVVDDKPVDHESIIALAAEDFDVAAADIKGGRRTKQLALARQVAMYLMRKTLSLSLKEIGFCFGGKDHTTVMYAVDKVERLRVADPSFDIRLKKLASGIKRG